MNDESGDDVEFLGSFSGLHDPRQQAKVLYPLPEILLLCLCAVLGGADSWVEVALYGQHKLAFLRRFLPYEHGVPSHDQLGNEQPCCRTTPRFRAGTATTRAPGASRTPAGTSTGWGRSICTTTGTSRRNRCRTA